MNDTNDPSPNDSPGMAAKKARLRAAAKKMAGDTTRLKADRAKDDQEYRDMRSMAARGNPRADSAAKAAFARGTARSDSLSRLRNVLGGLKKG